MVENIKAGNKYRVLSDSSGYFKAGDIVVALEDDNVPYCILEEHFTDIEDCLNNSKYHRIVRSMLDDELEEI